MTKNKKLILIISIAIAVVLIAGIILTIVLVNNNKRREATEASVMTCSVNPSVQLVLNENNKVMKVVALNGDGQVLALSGEFVGLSADDAAVVFVKLATETGYIDVETTGKEISFDISGTRDENTYKQIQENVVKDVNNYFKDNGIIAGATFDVVKLTDAIKELKPTATNTDGKSTAELLSHYLDITELIKNVDANMLDGFYTDYDEAIAQYNASLEEYNETIADLEEQLQALEAQLSNSSTNTALSQQIANLRNRLQQIRDYDNPINAYRKMLMQIC